MDIFKLGDNILDLQNAIFAFWNKQISLVFELLGQSPTAFKGGGPWGIIEGIEPIFVAVGSSLVVLFFVIGFCSESIDIREEMRFEVILRILIRLGLAEYMVANNVTIMKAFFTSVGNLVGLLTEGDRTTLKIAKEQADIIKDLGFGESLIMLILAALLSIIVLICGFFLIYTVYFRFLKLMVIVPIGSIAFSKEFRFNREESSVECLQALEEYNLDINGGAKGSLFHYEQKEHDFKQGEVLHNFNGTDYKVMERYSANNYLMMNMASGQFMVAVGLQYYSRYPYAGEYTKDNAEVGIEWGHGVYLSATPSEIDFVGLRAEYCEPYRQTGENFSIEIREVLSRVENIRADCLGDAIDEAVERYQSEKIVLDADDHKETMYLPVTVKNR